MSENLTDNNEKFLLKKKRRCLAIKMTLLRYVLHNAKL